MAARPRDTSHTITDLYRDFETALSVAAAIVAIPGDVPDHTYDMCNALAARICTSPANSATEAKLKVRVAMWSDLDHANVENLREVDYWKPEGDSWNNTNDALLSLRDDLVRLTSTAPAPDVEALKQIGGFSSQPHETTAGRTRQWP